MGRMELQKESAETLISVSPVVAPRAMPATVQRGSDAAAVWSL